MAYSDPFDSDYYEEEEIEQGTNEDLQSEAIQKIFEGLNPRQVEAVECLQGPLLIMAGAGSGKTRVLTCRIANLLAHGVAPWRILAITFTNKAANEMKTRAERMIGELAKSVWLSTFHSFCAKILRIEVDSVDGYNKNFVIYSMSDTKAVVRDCIRELNLDEKKFMDTQILSRISMAKNNLLDSKKYKEAVLFANNKSEYEWQVANVYELYEKRLLSLNAMDFDDLLMLTVRLFTDHQEILNKYQERFRYILVDEYQDTNEAQYQIMKLLAAKYENVCVVGDADQSIYGWRGADMRNILNFETDYPEATVIKLEQNYRSTKMILDAANAVIQHNKYRKPKELWTENGDGEKIIVFEALTGFYEAAKIVNEIADLKRNGFSYNDVALLYRINAQSRILEEGFVRAGIPYVIVGGLKFYDRMEIKNILAYLRLIYNLQDNMSLKRIINVPRRGIGLTTVAKLQDFAEKHDISIFEVISNAWLLNQVDVFPKTRQNLRMFSEFILNCRNMQDKLSVNKLISYILKNSGYMTELQTDSKPEDEARIENLEEFINVAKEFVSKSPEEATLDGFLNHISLISDLDVVEESEDRVSLMTVHSAKGLEFPVVFITGMEEGIFPHSRSLLREDQLEEERRACYVAITRAQKKLYITFADSRANFGGDTKASCNSRFLEEIPREYIDFYKQKTATKTSTPAFVHLVPRSSVKIEGLSKVSPKMRAKSNVMSMNTKKNKEKEKISANLSRNWQPGDRVNHKKWGDGIVLEVKGLGTERELRIKFLDKDVGIKTLSLMYAPITKVRE
ncbi:MAG: DNA helicase PcrA [Selenomonadaceae bacterium]|nr:DNA helicase PcrA [Selenomonadaceae bacterium]